MANVYDGRMINSGKIPEPVRNLSLFSLICSDGEFAIEGINIFSKNSIGYERQVEDFRNRLGRVRKCEELAATVARYRQNEFLTAETGLGAVSYECYAPDSLDKYYSKKIIYDTVLNAVCELAVPKRSIDVFRGIKTGDNFLLDPWSNALSRGWYYYDGSFEEALGEFESRGFEFRLWNKLWRSDFLDKGKIVDTSVGYVPVAEKVKLEDVIKFARKEFCEELGPKHWN